MPAPAPRPGKTAGPAIVKGPASPLAWAAAWAARLLGSHQTSFALGLLHQGLEELAPLTNFIVFEFSLDSQPTLVESNYEPDYMLAAMSAYRKGLYLLDPFWPTVIKGHAGLVSMDDLAPEDFRRSEYFLHHYEATGVLDELRYVVPLRPARCVHVFVEREAPLPAFDNAERLRLADVEPLVRAFVAAHFAWRDRQGCPAEPRPAFDLREQIHAIEPGAITPREVDIIELMLKGHSAKSIARMLNIEEGTVTNHKRNIYAKLSVHSQAQLFDRFLRTLTAA